MKVGTKSLLFGVHQFAWHPITVALAWRKFHGKWPTWSELVAIFVHDCAYWGASDIDGPEGKLHPIRSAAIAAALVTRLSTFLMLLLAIPAFLGRPRALWAMRKKSGRKYFMEEIHQFAIRKGARAFLLVRYHSRSIAKSESAPVSLLCAPDKLSVLFDPDWFYLLRARLSGEIKEYVRNAEPVIGNQPDHVWLAWYKNTVQKNFPSQ